MRRFPGPIASASLLAGLLVCLAPTGLSAQALPTPSIADSSVASAIDRARQLLLHHMEGTGVPGVQVAVWKDGRIVWSEGLGWADAENRAPVGPETRFPVGSVSKALTAVGAMRLTDRGVLDLDAPVRRYVPRVPGSHEGITPRLLGQHLAGIRHYRGDEEPGAERHYESVDEALDLFLGDSLLFEPGARFAYSSYGFNLLSAVMEGAAGQEFLAVMEEEVFGPLGLTGTMANEVDRLIPSRTQGYTMADGRRVEADEEDPSYKWAGGGFLSTSEDLVRVGAALLEPGFLSEEALSTLFTEARPADGERTHYGFGWEVYRTEAGRPVRFHGGNLPYARAHLMIFPEDRIVFAHLANTGTSIFFNNGEAQWLAELFLPGRAGVDSTRAAGWSGGYAFRSVENTLAQDPDGRVRAVPGDTIAGRLTLHERDGLLRGTLTIGSRSMAVSAAGDVDGSLQLLAVSRGWRKVWLTRTAGGYEGRWVSAGLPSGRLRVEGRLLDVRRVAPRGGD